MYRMTYSGKYWYLDLKEGLIEEGIAPSRASPCFFCKVFPDGSSIKLAVYDKLCFGNNEATLQEFKDKLSRDLKWNSWVKLTGINQQGFIRMLTSTEKAGAKRKPRLHSKILPAEFALSVEDFSKDEETAKTLQEEY
jgi:hypothetical protein